MSKAKVFVIMPFTDEFFESYDMLKNNFENDFEFSHAAEEDNQQNILADIILPIYNADIILADLTNLNPNVMYELGIAHGFNKKTIIITRDDLKDLPFDLKQYRAKNYTMHYRVFFEMLSYLDKNLQGAINGSVIFSNPVKDFLEKNKLDSKQLFKEEALSINIQNKESGFIDFLSEIEDDTNKMTEHMQDMSQELQEMTAGIDYSTSEIERVNKIGGSGTASFIRSETKKVASHMDTFSEKLKGHNEAYNSLWSKIEKNILGLLENKYVSTSDNKDSLIEYLKSLYELQKTIKDSNISVNGLKEANLNNLGIERSMNHSIRFLNEDLSTYLTITNQMDSSIDRIINKSKFVVGSINFE